MNRGIDTRLQKMERAIGPNPDDEFGLSKLSHDDLIPLQHTIMAGIVADERGLFTSDEIATMRDKLANLEAEVWRQIQFLQRPDVAEATPAIDRLAASQCRGNVTGKGWRTSGDCLTLPASYRRRPSGGSELDA